MSIVEQILSSHANKEKVSVGEIVTVTVDRIYLQDGNSPTIARLFKENDFTQVFDPDHVGVFFDHAVLAPDKLMSNMLQEAKKFAVSMGLRIFEPGTGISHVVALEEGWFLPQTIVIGADSHTCTGGVVQCLGLGMGASDVVAAMVTGKTWLKVPETHWIEIVGEPGPYTRTKDVMLYALAKLGVTPFLYKSIEWIGDWLKTLSLDSAATLANMGVEMGAKCVFLPPTLEPMEGLIELTAPPKGDPRRLQLDITNLPPYVALPHSPMTAVPLDQCAGQPIDYVFVGSCANSRLEDIREVAGILSQGHVHKDLHCVITPGSKSVYIEALRSGLIESLVRAGALVTPPGCGACVGTQGTIPASGQRVLSTMNRNFKGRMGNAEADILLSSPLVAAYTAILGRIPGLGDLA